MTTYYPGRRPPEPLPIGPVETMPLGFVDRENQELQLRSVLAAASLTLGHYDKRMLLWLAGWDWSTVATITSWVRRAAHGEGAPNGQPEACSCCTCRTGMQA